MVVIVIIALILAVLAAVYEPTFDTAILYNSYFRSEKWIIIWINDYKHNDAKTRRWIRFIRLNNE